MFQSSPVTEDRCNHVRGPACAEGVCFNPHRSLRTGATGRQLRGARPSWGFNPHRSLRTGATTAQGAPPAGRTVSILTGH